MTTNRFKQLKGTIEFKDDIRLICDWAYEHFYKEKNDGMGSAYHGILHHARCAFYTPVVINLFCRYLQFTISSELLQQIRIAVVLHDSGRMGEEEDIWQKESGLIVYQVMTEVFNIPPSKAKVFAEAVANKDAKESYALLNTETQTWILFSNNPNTLFDANPDSGFTKAEIQLLFDVIYEVDCLDGGRAKDNGFDGRYLRFYQKIARDNPKAFTEVSELIRDVTSIMQLTGDNRAEKSNEVNHQFEKTGVYELIISAAKKYCRLFPLLQERLIPIEELRGLTLVDRKPYDEKAELTAENLEACAYAGKVLLRGIRYPSGVRFVQDEKTKETRESTLTEIELHFIGIRKFPCPVTLFVPGAGFYSQAGLGIANYDEKSLQYMSEVDCHSGPAEYREKVIKDKGLSKNHEEVKSQMANVMFRHQLGSPSCRHPTEKTLMTHTEGLYHIKRFNCVWFTKDYSYANLKKYFCRFQTPYLHDYSAEFQAVYIQRDHERLTGVKLRLFELSGVHRFVRQHEFTDDMLCKMWGSMAYEYFKLFIDAYAFSYCHESVEKIKTMLAYKHIFRARVPYDELKSPDSNYLEPLKQRVNREIEDAKSRAFLEYQNDKLKSLCEMKVESISDLSIEKAFSIFEGQELELKKFPEINVDLLMNQVKAYLMKGIHIFANKENRKDTSYYIMGEVTALINFARFFKLENFILNDLKKAVTQVFSMTLDHYLKAKDYDRLTRHALFLSRKGVLEASIIFKIADIAQNIKKQIIATPQPFLYECEVYLVLACAAKINPQEQKEVIDHLLNNPTFKFEIDENFAKNILYYAFKWADAALIEKMLDRIDFCYSWEFKKANQKIKEALAIDAESSSVFEHKEIFLKYRQIKFKELLAEEVKKENRDPLSVPDFIELFNEARILNLTSDLSILDGLLALVFDKLDPHNKVDDKLIKPLAKCIREIMGSQKWAQEPLLRIIVKHPSLFSELTKDCLLSKNSMFAPCAMTVDASAQPPNRAAQLSSR